MTALHETLPPLSPPPAVPGEAAHQFRSLVCAFRAGQGRMQVLLLIVATLAVICATALGQIRLNAWNRPFYEAIAERDLDGFVEQLLVFAAIVSVLLVLNVAQTWLHQTLRLRLREWLTRDLLGEWLQRKRAFRIARIPGIGANPDQRIHQDGQHLSDLSADLGVGLFQSGLLLASFIGVLWVLSSGVVIRVGGTGYDVPGYMVWCALLYAALGSWLSWRVGRPLVGLNASRYAREAELRAALVRTHEHADGIALHGDESSERQRLLAELADVVAVMRRVIGASVRLQWITSGYGWIAIVVPILVASPGYFGGSLSLGELMMAVGAFYQVQQGLRWFVDNAAAIADWRATLLRVMSFRDALLALDGGEPPGEAIELAADPSGRIAFEGLSVATPAGPARLAEGDVVLQPGERVLAVGRPGSGKSTMYHAIAGLWPHGSGRIVLPPAARLAFLPQRPYVPYGTLRGALTLSAERALDDAALAAALQRVGLGHLGRALDRAGRWDQELTPGELHRLAGARLLLTRPDWVISDEALDLLDDTGGDAAAGSLLSLFRQELAGTGVLSFSRRASPDGFYGRQLHLVGPAGGPPQGRPPLPAAA